MLLDCLKTQIYNPSSHNDYLIAYSGGLDSHVLLHLMVELRQQFPALKLQVVHIHHGLSRYASAWADHCQNVCALLPVKFSIEKIDHTPPPKASIEAWAREARYAIFKKKLAVNATLMTAHTQDDQTETVLLQLLRGAGPKGLAAMKSYQPFGQGYLWRPLLNSTRQQLHHYALQHQLTWIEDESNQDCRFDRNYLRHQIIPKLRQRWPAVAKNITRSASHCEEAAMILSDLGHQDIVNHEGSDNQLSIELLHKLSPLRQRNALRHWFAANGCRLPSTKRLQQIQQNLLYSRADANPQVNWDQWIVRRFRQFLILLPAPSLSVAIKKISWNLQSPLYLPNNLGEISVSQQMGQGIRLPFGVNNLSIQFRQGGERCRLKGKSHSDSLKKLFQQWGVPPWQRDQIPLLYDEDKLVSIIGYGINQEFAAEQNELGLVIIHTSAQ